MTGCKCTLNEHKRQAAHGPHHSPENSSNERKSEQTNIPQAPTLLENAVYNKWQFQTLVTGNLTENQFHLNCTI